MNLVKIKRFEDKYGRVLTELPKSRHYRDIQKLTAVELAQLACDLMTVPQDKLRPAEAQNLFILLLKIGRERYGRLFHKQIAIQFMNSLGDGISNDQPSICHQKG